MRIRTAAIWWVLPRSCAAAAGAGASRASRSARRRRRAGSADDRVQNPPDGRCPIRILITHILRPSLRLRLPRRRQPRRGCKTGMHRTRTRARTSHDLSSAKPPRWPTWKPWRMRCSRGAGRLPQAVRGPDHPVDDFPTDEVSTERGGQRVSTCSACSRASACRSKP